MKEIHDANSFDAEVVKQSGLVLVDFYTEGCSPCRNMNPILAELAKEQADLKNAKVDAGANSEMAARFGISVVPTFVLFNNGQAKAQCSGFRRKKELVSWIEANR